MLGANRVTVVVVILPMDLPMDVKQVKIKFKLKFFNLSCFSIFFCLLAPIPE